MSYTLYYFLHISAHLRKVRKCPTVVSLQCKVNSAFTRQLAKDAIKKIFALNSIYFKCFVFFGRQKTGGSLSTQHERLEADIQAFR